MDDERIIELFFQRNEDAIKYTNETYGKRLFHLADNITKNDEDAEECVNSTYMKTWNTIPSKVSQLLLCIHRKDLQTSCFG